MELPDIGEHCSKSDCHKLDFLPIKCDGCSKIFCREHYSYLNHSCKSAYRKNNQVPECPLCNKPIPVGKGDNPDRVVGAHIDNDCQTEISKKHRVFINRCSLQGCKNREVVPVICNDCKENFCLKHRHPHDHNCKGEISDITNNTRDLALNAAITRQKTPQVTPQYSQAVIGNLSEDEALARAIALSMQESSTKTQEDLDLELARQLQATEYPSAAAVTAGDSSSSHHPKDKCNIV